VVRSAAVFRAVLHDLPLHGALAHWVTDALHASCWGFPER